MTEEMLLEVSQHLEKIKNKEKSETDRFELKESTSNIYQIFKTMAGMANNTGGYILIGIKDDKTIEGMSEKSKTYFSNLHNTQERGRGFAQMLTSMFQSVPVWDSEIIDFNGDKIGVIIVSEAKDKPVIAKTNSSDGTVVQGKIYYHYVGETLKIGYAEIRAIIDKIKKEERETVEHTYNEIFSKIILHGIARAKVIDPATMTMHGAAGNFTIDERLFEKLKEEFNFIREGEFDEVAGAETLSVVGDISIQGGSKLVTKVRIAGEDVTDAIHVQLTDENFLDPYPYINAELMVKVKERVAVFSQTDFNAAKKQVQQSREMSLKRLHNPKSPKSSQTYFYNDNAVEFIVNYINSKASEATDE